MARAGLGKKLSAYWHVTLLKILFSPIFSASIWMKHLLLLGKDDTQELAIERAVLERSIPTRAPAPVKRSEISLDTAPVPQARSNTKSFGSTFSASTNLTVALKGPTFS